MATKKKTKEILFKDLTYADKLRTMDLLDIRSLVQGMSLTLKSEAMTLESKARKMVMVLNIGYQEALAIAEEKLNALRKRNMVLREVAKTDFGMVLRK